MRRGPKYNYRFLRNENENHLEVHDLDNEKTGLLECQIDEIIAAGNAYYIGIDNTLSTLKDWLNKNPSYDGCNYCLPQFHRK